MEDEPKRDGVAASAAAQGAAGSPGAPRWTRRQAIGRMSAVAAAGAAAWVAPEILTATPASGAPLSGATEAAVMGASPATSAASTGEPPIVTLAGSLATTGLDLERDAVIGGALVAGGWAMKHWASRPLHVAAEGAAAAGAAEGASESAGGAGIPTEAE